MTSQATEQNKWPFPEPEGGGHAQTLPAVIASNHNIERNEGMPFDLGLINSIVVNTNGVQKRASEFGARRTVKKKDQVEWLLRAIQLMDLTTLSGDDTYGKVDRLCAKARNPVSAKILEGLKAKFKVDVAGITTGAVCVYHEHVKDAVEFLQGTNIPVAAVSTGFPHGQSPFKTRLDEIHASVEAGAKEIDIVITRELALTGKWQKLYDEMKAYREACGEAHLKTILGTGDLGTLDNIAKASWVCMMAGADFIKTSTGKEGVNANLPVSLVMVRALRSYEAETSSKTDPGFKVGYKPAGGIATAKDALENMFLIKEELGDEWLTPALFRFGASSLLNDIERQLEHNATQQYSAGFRHAMA